MKNFVVLADKRTGSSFLQECLNSHSEIKCYDEVFLIRSGLKKRRGQFLYRHMKKTKGKNYTIDKYLDFLYKTENISEGFRLMYPQDKYFNVLPYIKKRNIPIIHLIRENTLKMVISKKTKGIFVPEKMYYSPEIIKADILNHKKKEKENSKAIKKYKNKITIYYKDMIGKSDGKKGKIKKFGAFNLKSDMITYIQEETGKKICDFIGVENKKLFSNVTKKNSNNVWDYIENVDEIKEMLKKNNWKHMI